MKLFYEKYIKIAHIGKGANAHVYQVRHAELGYVRAIKILNDYIEKKSDRAYQSFLKECKTLLAIGNGSHPNIVHIYGPDLIDNRAIVEMDYIQGVTLDSYIKEKGFLDYDEIKTFIHDIVGALAYTHHDIYKFLMNPEEDNLEIDSNDGKKYLISPEKEAELVKKYGIAHNDLHSNNVMRRDYDGNFVLLDFGLAVQDGECIKSSCKSDGSPEYKAPEKFDSSDITPRSDVYSLGVLIYEVLTGRPPFILEICSDGKVSYPSLSKICDEHHNLVPPQILPLRKEAFERQIPGAVYERDYPEWLDDVVTKCLAKKPEDRYADAKELLNDINWHISQDGRQSISRLQAESIPSLDSIEEGKDGSTVPSVSNNHNYSDNHDTIKFVSKLKSKKIYLLYIISFCLIAIVGILYFFLPISKEHHDYIPATEINFPATEYLLNIGDSVVVIPSVIPANASDSIVTLTSSNPEIAVVKGDTIIALKSGNILLTASTRDAEIRKDVSVNISEAHSNVGGGNILVEKVSGDKSSDNFSNRTYKRKYLQRPTKSETLVNPKPNSMIQKGDFLNKPNTPTSINFSYGTWYGTSKKGKPHGKGKLVFSSAHKVDRKTNIVANPGDYFEAVYENGQLISGSLFDNAGNKKNTIIP